MHRFALTLTLPTPANSSLGWINLPGYATNHENRTGFIQYRA